MPVLFAVCFSPFRFHFALWSATAINKRYITQTIHRIFVTVCEALNTACQFLRCCLCVVLFEKWMKVVIERFAPMTAEVKAEIYDVDIQPNFE
jgi:hypothetical protein